MNYYTSVLKKYAVFGGRARRKEYWMFVLVNMAVSIGIGMVDAVLGSNSLLGSLYGLVVLVPSLAVFVRRMHDTGRSGWWWLIVLIPFIGWIVLLVWLCSDSQPGDNKYGPNPKGVAGAAAPTPPPAAPVAPAAPAAQ